MSTPKFGVKKLDPNVRPRVDIDLNNALDEIDKKGCSLLLSGLAIDRPSSGSPYGTYYYETDTQRFLRYNGLTWLVIHPVQDGTVTGSTLDPNYSLSGRCFDFGSSLVWNDIPMRYPWSWPTGFQRPQWARDHMGIVTYRGYATYSTTNHMDPEDHMMFEFSSTHPGGVGPPEPYDAANLAIWRDGRYSLGDGDDGYGVYPISAFVYNYTLPGPPSRLMRGFAVGNIYPDMVVDLSAIIYST